MTQIMSMKINSCNSEEWHSCIKHFASAPNGGSHCMNTVLVCKAHNNPPLPPKRKSTIFGAFLGGRGWIRTTEVTDNRFTVCSLWPLGNPPRWS